MSTETRRSEAGLSSVEFCLMMPILFIIILGTYHASKYMLAQERFAIAARRAAWSASMHENVQGQSVCTEKVLEETFGQIMDPGWGVPSYTITCSNNANGFDTQFTRDMANANQTASSNDADNLVQTIDGATSPLFSRAVFQFDYDSGGFLTTVSGNRSGHSVSANRSWELGLLITQQLGISAPGNLPIGYDQVLKDRLGRAEGLFEAVFPKAN